MADQQINESIRYARYGRIIFNWTALGDDCIVHNRIDDSLNVKLGGMARHDWDYDNNTLVTDRREGRELSSNVSFRVKRSDLTGADELYARQLLASSGTGIVPPFDLKLELLDANGAATGELATFADCVFSGGVEFSEGSGMDEMPISIDIPHGMPTISTF